MTTAPGREVAAPPPPDLQIPAAHVIIVFGATGDLARRRLWPGLYHLHLAGLMPLEFQLIGAARADRSDEDLQALARTAVQEAGHARLDEQSWAGFARRLSYTGIVGEDGRNLAAAVDAAEQRSGTRLRRLHYLSVPPAAMGAIVRQIGRAGLNLNSRVVLEKPFGTDLASARQLNTLLHDVFEESQVFRIDHFLGKEAVQNILALRFANGMWESVWDREHIEYVQIDVPETLGVATRTAFYEATGAYRDMVVTHLFQVLGFVAMETPAALHAAEIAAAKEMVFHALRPLAPDDVVRAQYTGYTSEPGVTPTSPTETFVAVRAWVDNPRWRGVPFYLRTGKQMKASRRVVTVAFRDASTRMFHSGSAIEEDGSNHLSFDLDEPGSLSLGFLAKTPGPGIDVQPGRFTYSFALAPQHTQSLHAYERLIYDVLTGDPMLFNSAKGIERLWQVSEPLLVAPSPLRSYPPGTWGPTQADELIAPHHWHLGPAAG